ncbi:MAG: nicotinamide riboside transporter PnuC [Ginsengibacter sp.]
MRTEIIYVGHFADLNDSKTIFGPHSHRLNLPGIYQQFIEGLYQTTLLEYIAVIFGIASVIFSRMENLLVYPVGMVNTSIYIYLYLTHGLYADASVNFYYTVMSIIGWSMWAKKNGGHTALMITKSSKGDWKKTFIFFGACFLVLWLILKNFTDSTVPLADAFTSAAAFTGMWLMNKKKIENWIWWIITNLASIPLNFYKHLVFTSFQYLVFLILAVMGYITWKKKLPLAQA